MMNVYTPAEPLAPLPSGQEPPPFRWLPQLLIAQLSEDELEVPQQVM
jgi:hypothetical protein